MGELTALPDFLAGFKGHTSNKWDRKGKKGREMTPRVGSHLFMLKILKNTLR